MDTTSSVVRVGTPCDEAAFDCIGVMSRVWLVAEREMIARMVGGMEVHRGGDVLIWAMNTLQLYTSRSVFIRELAVLS